MSTSSPANAPFFSTHIFSKVSLMVFFLFFEEVTRARAHMRKSKLCSDCAWTIVQQVDFWVSKLTLCQKNVVQGGEDIEDASSCRSFFAKETLIIGLFCRKWPMTFEKRCTGWRRHRGCLIMYTSCYDIFTQHVSSCTQHTMIHNHVHNVLWYTTYYDTQRTMMCGVLQRVCGVLQSVCGVRGCLIMYTSYYREVGGWGRDPKKCTGRDWGMGSSTI